MTLTSEEHQALARKMVDVALDRVFEMGRISWEDLPELEQSEWEAVTAVFDAFVATMVTVHDRLDRQHEVDRRELWARFS